MVDKRGLIRDLFVDKDRSVTRITFKPGAVRGNHIHKKTTQIDILLRGSLLCATQFQDEKSQFVLNEGGVIIHPPKMAHAYEAIEHSEMISICFGKRVGKNYDQDTFKLKTQLL